MKVILTDNRSDLGGRSAFAYSDCACDCNCACPTDSWPCGGTAAKSDRMPSGEPIPVLSLPVAYYLELTPACNNCCPGCGNAATFSARGQADQLPQAAPLDGKGWGDLIARLASHARQFKLTGGEPTLHPDLAGIVRQIDSLGIPFTLFTNGRWPDPDALLRLLGDAEQFDGFLISLHGPDAAAHEAFSGVPGSFAETVTHIRRAVDAGHDVAVSMVINQHNWDRLAETLDFVLRLGANHLVCNRMIGSDIDGRDATSCVSTRDSVASLAPSEAQLRAAVVEVERVRARGRPVRFGNCIPQCFEPSSSRGCTAGTTFATIDPWGRMRPCNHVPVIAGDLRTQSVQDVWQGEVMERWRASVPEGCSTCAAFATCHGGCRAQGMLAGAGQDPLISGPGRSPAKEQLVPVPVLRLYDQLRPTGKFVRRTERGVDLLFSKSTVVRVPGGGAQPRSFAQLAASLDGSLSLQQIQRQYGDTAVNWVGMLYREGFVTWTSA